MESPDTNKSNEIFLMKYTCNNNNSEWYSLYPKTLSVNGSPSKRLLELSKSASLKNRKWNRHHLVNNHLVRTKGNYSSWSPLLSSPLTRLTGGRRERAIQLGLTPPTQKKQPFELNQSFPDCGTRRKPRHDNVDMGDSITLAKKCTLSKFKGDALNSFSFSPSYPLKRTPVHLNADGFQRHSKSLSSSWAFYNFVGCSSQPGSIFPTVVNNPNKAVITINAKTTEILVTNKMACALLGLSQSKMAGKRLCDYLLAKKYYTALTETQLDSNGQVVLVSGKVMDLINKAQDTIPVSVWMRSVVIDNEPRCIVVMEPVERTVGLFSFDEQGQILYADNSMCALHGYESFNQISKLLLRDLMPSINLPTLGNELTKDMKKQNITGRTSDGYPFPISIRIDVLPDDPTDCKTPTEELNDDNIKSVQYQGVAWVFANISGLITILPDGTIHSCNDNFSSMLFGYSQNQLVGKNILQLIPSFYEDIDFLDTDSMPLPPLDDDDNEDEVDGISLACSAGNRYIRPTSEELVNPPRYYIF